MSLTTEMLRDEIVEAMKRGEMTPDEASRKVKMLHAYETTQGNGVGFNRHNLRTPVGGSEEFFPLGWLAKRDLKARQDEEYRQAHDLDSLFAPPEPGGIGAYVRDKQAELDAMPLEQRILMSDYGHPNTGKTLDVSRAAGPYESAGHAVVDTVKQFAPYIAPLALGPEGAIASAAIAIPDMVEWGIDKYRGTSHPNRVMQAANALYEGVGMDPVEENRLSGPNDKYALATGALGMLANPKMAPMKRQLIKNVITAEAAQPNISVRAGKTTPLANILNTNWTDEAAGPAQSEQARRMITMALGNNPDVSSVKMGQGFWQDAAGRQFNPMAMVTTRPGADSQQIGAQLGKKLYQYGVGHGQITEPPRLGDYLRSPLEAVAARSGIKTNTNALGVRVGDNEDAVYLAKLMNQNPDVVDTLMVHDPSGMAYLKPLSDRYTLDDIRRMLAAKGFKGRNANLSTDFLESAP